MYAIYFVLFLETLVLSHVLHMCLKSYSRDQVPEEPTEPSDDSQSSEEEENSTCPFAPWSGWSKCTVTCGDGVSVRHRIVLILENCSEEMIQERTCSEWTCPPHDREFIFERKEEDHSQSPSVDENQHAVNDDDAHKKQEDIKTEGNPNHSEEKRVTDYSNVLLENLEADNLKPDRGGQTEEDATREHTRGHSWTSDDGNTWDHQSSFDSHREGKDDCFTDCSPSDPPPDQFGSSRNSRKGSEHAENENSENGAKSERKESFVKENDDSLKEEQKLNDEKLRHDNDISNDEDNQLEAETDFDNDDDGNDFDDGVDDNDDYDADGVDQDENESTEERGKRQKQDFDEEEEEGEQDDLEQEEEPDGKSKCSRKKQKRRRKRRKTKHGDAEERAKRNSQVVCDPVEICDTFMAAV